MPEPKLRGLVSIEWQSKTHRPLNPRIRPAEGGQRIDIESTKAHWTDALLDAIKVGRNALVLLGAPNTAS